jgi:hypothetical protein
VSDFGLVITGATVQPWIDPDGASAPSRLNPRSGRTERRLVGVVGAQIILLGYVGGVVLDDDQLDDRLFVAASIEAPHPYPVTWTSLPTTSAVQRFTPALPGHYLVYLRRDGGGMVLAHIDVEAA